MVNVHRATTSDSKVVAPKRAASPSFTLVEMMIVVLIISIIGAMAVARLGNTSLTRLRAAANVLAADLSFAQVESIAHADSPRVVVFNPTTSTYHIATTADLDVPITNPITKTPYSVRFGHGTAATLEGVTLSPTGVGGDNKLAFGAYGQIDQATSATVTLLCNGSNITLTINAITGEVTISDIISN